MPRGKRDPVPLPHAKLPSANGEGLRGGGDGRRSASEEEGLAQDDLTKSMSSSSVSSYHSALCSDGTETFKDCLEFLDEETPPRAGGAEGAVPGRWAPTGTPRAPPPAGPLARPRKAQLSNAAKNSPAPGQGGRMGPHGSQQPAKATSGTTAELARARPAVGMLAGTPSDSDEADGEVRALTARAFRSLSGPHGTRLDMCSSHTSSSLSNSLSEDGGRPQRWPAAGVELLQGRAGWPFPTRMDPGELLGLAGKEQFECVDVELESGEARKGHGKKRTVPKRQILLKRKERKETGFGPRGDGAAPQPLPPARKEPPGKGRAVGEDFRLNYKQFMKTASLDADTGKTRAASCLVKNVLAKKMQYEQRIKMEQKGLRGSSTSSGPSSMGTDLPGDGLEGKSSSLSRSDCSFSAEDLRGGEIPVAAVAVGDITTTRPTKGVVLSEATKESVCKLKKTFNELNERMKYREALEGNRLPGAAEEPVPARIRYQQARALFEAHPEVGKALDVAPRFGRAPKPWPSLRQRAIRPSYSQPLPLEAERPVLPALPPRRLFTSQAQEVRLVPQSQQEEKPPAVPPPVPARGSPPAAPRQVEDKGKGRIPQPRDVRKLVKSSYSLCFRASSASHGSTVASGDPPAATPLVIHCTSVRRQDTTCQRGDGEELVATGPEPSLAHAEVPGKVASTHQPSPTHSNPVHITRVQATRRGAAAVEEPVASPPRRERSELRVPPRAPTAEGVPHVESHLHVLVGRRSPAAAREDPPAQSSATLRTEKTVLLPPPPPSPTEGKDGGGHGGTGGVGATERPESVVQQRGDSGEPHARALAGSRAHTQDEEPVERRAPKPPTSEWASAGSSGSAGSTGPTTLVQAREAGEGASGQLPGQRETWEHLSKWSAASEPHLAASPPENSNYLTIPVKASKSSPMPKLPSIPTPDTTSLGTPVVPKLVSASSGTPSVPNPASASFGAYMVPNPASRSLGTSSVPSMTSSSCGYASASSLDSTSFRAPLVSSPSTRPLGAPLIPYPVSASFGNPLAPNLSGAPFGAPLAPNPSSASFGAPLAPNPSSASFGASLASNPSGGSFGPPMVPNTANISFGIPLVSNPSSASFGTPLAPNPSSASFGVPLVPNSANTSVPKLANSSLGIPLVSNQVRSSFGSPLIPNQVSSSFGSPLIPNQVSSSFGSPLIPNPVPASLGHPSVSNVGSSSFGSPSAPSLEGAPPGSGVAPLAGVGAPWSKPSSEPLQPRPSEGLAAAERPGPLAPAQPRLEDIPHFLRRTEGASPSSKSAPSPPKPFAPHLPGHRRMLVDPDSGKCYYMEPPRQPQLKMLYDPETGQYLEVLIPPVASHTGLYQAPFNPLVVTPGVYAPPYVPYGGFTGLPAPAAPSPVHPEPPAVENPGFSGTFSPTPKSEGAPAAGSTTDCGYLESLYYIPTGMRASPGPSHPPARTSPEKGPRLPM